MVKKEGSAVVMVNGALQTDTQIAVVMITHNRVQEVLKSIKMLEQLPENPHIVLIDNASTDGTVEEVGKQFPDVEIIDVVDNIGAAARTLGVRHVKTPFVAFCDDDVWWEPGSLARAVEIFERVPRLAVLTGRVLVGKEEREDPTCDVLARSPLPRDPGMPGVPLLGFLAGASVVRRSAYLDAGGFEPRFFIGGEEELLAADLVAKGWWVCYIPELTVHHYPSTHRDASGRRGTMARNALWFAWMRRPLRTAIHKTLRFVWSHPGSLETWRTLAESMRGLPWVLKNRRVLPANVELGLRILEGKC